MRSNPLRAAPVLNANKRYRTIGKPARAADRPYERNLKMKKTNWLAVSLIVIVALLAFFWIGSMFGGGYGMMGGYGRPSMMGNWGYSPFGSFGMGFGMLFMWLIPIGVIALIVYGVVALTRNAGNNTPNAFSKSCPNCGKGVQGDWKNCPHCGTAL